MSALGVDTSRRAVPRVPAQRATWREFWSRNRIPAAITSIFLVLFALFIAASPVVFLSYDIYRSFMSTIPFFGILAIGATFIVSLGEIDLSFPSVLGLSAWVFAIVSTTTDSFLLAFALCLALGLALGLINGLLVAKVGIPSIVATIGTMFLWRGLVNVLVEGKGIALANLDGTLWHDGTVGRIGGQVPMQFVWFILLAVIFGLIYRRHRFGSQVLFVGDNEASARMVGVPTDRIKIQCYVLMGGLAAAAGMFSLCEVGYFWPTQGEGMLLTTLAAVFIGGTSVFGGKGTMWGTVIGVLLIGSLEAGILSIGLSGFWVQFCYGLLITVSVLVYAVMLKRAR